MIDSDFCKFLLDRLSGYLTMSIAISIAFVCIMVVILSVYKVLICCKRKNNSYNKVIDSLYDEINDYTRPIIQITVISIGVSLFLVFMYLAVLVLYLNNLN